MEDTRKPPKIKLVGRMPAPHEVGVNRFYWIQVEKDEPQWMIARLEPFTGFGFQNPSQKAYFECVSPGYDSETLTLPETRFRMCWVIGLSIVPPALIRRVVGPLEPPA